MSGIGRRMSEGALPDLSQLVRALDRESTFAGDATIFGDDPVIRSPHRLGTASATAILLGGVMAAAVRKLRTGEDTDVGIDIDDALHHLHPTHFVTQAGYPMNVGAEHVATNGIFTTRDGQHFMIEAGPPYPKLLDGYLAFFNCPNRRDALAQSIATWDAEPLENALARAGLPGCRAFSYDQWTSHPQGRSLSGTPVIDIEKIDDGDPVEFTRGSAPLEGVRVVDFTHVLAGPRSTQTLAEYGANVLHISSPNHPDTLAQHLCVDHGKRCAYLDLTRCDDSQSMAALLADADVFASTYRPSVNERFGLTPTKVAASSRLGIVYLTVTAYGHDGPWRSRPGFDQNAQVATGFAVREGGPQSPRFSPVFYLADLITGHLAAAGMMAALLRRATEGGSYHVKLSLARSAMWVQELGLIGDAAIADAPSVDLTHPRIHATETAFGTVSALSSPLTFSNLELPRTTRLVPYGADAPVWI